MDRALPCTLDDRYSLLARLGRGGMGDVYEGLQRALDRHVAIKVLRPEFTSSEVSVGRFLREARTLSRLHHPNVVTVFDIGRTAGGVRYLVMELLQGQTLGAHLRRAGPLEVEAALEIAAQIVRGMGAGQGVGLVHRDLKPENLFLTDDDQVKILDFGLALLREHLTGEQRLALSDTLVPPLEDEPPPSDDPSLVVLRASASRRVTTAGSVLGTPCYMAPEQALGWRVDHRADLYAFGCILFEMLAGHPPFEAGCAKDYMDFHVHATPPALEDYAPEAPTALCALVGSLLEKDPARRPQDWSALADALRALAPGPAPAGGAGALARGAARPTEPYRFLQPFSPATRSIFYGRDGDAERFRWLWEHPDQIPLLMLTGTSGVGKTSFLYARVVPGLQDMGHEVICVRGGAGPMEAARGEVRRQLARTSAGAGERPLPEQLDQLSAALGRPITVVLDQLEELFTGGGPDDVAAFQAALASVVGGGDRSVRFILSIREDYLGQLLRALHPLPLDQLARTLSLRPLGVTDVRAALAGPAAPAAAVAYAPFTFEPGLLDEIVDDLVSEGVGQVAPRIQAAGYRLWEMVRGDEAPIITRAHYRERLGGARGIVGRVLDEAIAGLPPEDRGLAKEMLRALTHLPGSATSNPSPTSCLVGGADSARRGRVLEALESRWRVLQGYTDPRWPEERSYRVAHEALIDRIRDYGEENSERNRARQCFQHGLSLWLKNGRQPDELLSEVHFDLVLAHAGALVITTNDQRAYFDACRRVHNEGWLARHQEAQRQRLMRGLRWFAAPALLLAAGFLLGQAPLEYTSLRVWWFRAVAGSGVPGVDLGDYTLRGADLQGRDFDYVRLRGADLYRSNLAGTSLVGAALAGANLGGADLRGADLRGADLRGARLGGAAVGGADLRDALLEGDLVGARVEGGGAARGPRWGRPPRRRWARWASGDAPPTPRSRART